jgi:cytochrome bd-type quinol oxidase subunit 2
MTVTAAPTAPTTTTDPRTTALWRTASRAGVVAAAATTAVAAGALAAGVPLEVDGEQIPLAGFAQLTLLCTVVGLVVAKALARWASRPQRTFAVTAVALTGLSFVPDLAIAATSATKVVLMATHVVAAVLVVPALAGRLPERSL